MSHYNYKEGKKRIQAILNNKLSVHEQDSIPQESQFTFENAYYGWVTAIFVDIRNSTKLFSEGDKEKVSKIIRSFTSEIIEILREDDNLREIGIRGDCVYAIYTTPSKNNEYSCFFKTSIINTYMQMLNKLLATKNYPQINVGIGMATDKELVVKAGRKGTGINNLVWIGDAVTKASNLSSVANKNTINTICYSYLSYTNIIDLLNQKFPDKNVRSWFTEHSSVDLKTYYSASIVDTDFQQWITNGMKD